MKSESSSVLILRGDDVHRLQDAIEAAVAQGYVALNTVRMRGELPAEMTHRGSPGVICYQTVLLKPSEVRQV